MNFEEATRLVYRALRLETERLVAMASIGRLPGASADAVDELDTQLESTLKELNKTFGLAFPPHKIAGQYGLTGPGYTLLVLALSPFHSPDLLRHLGAAFGGDAAPRLSYAMRLLAPAAADYTGMRRAMAAQWPVLTERLVYLDDLPDGDALLLASPAVLELLGLADDDPPEQT